MSPSLKTHPYDCGIDVYVAGHGRRFEAWLAILVERPSVSAAGEGMAECAQTIVLPRTASRLDVDLLRAASGPAEIAARHAIIDLAIEFNSEYSSVYCAAVK